MPQPKPAKPATPASRPAARKPAAKGATSVKSASRPATKKSSLAGKKAARTAPEPAAIDPASAEAQAARDEAMRANLSQLRELLAGGVMLTAQRVQDAMDDAVRRGKMTRRDAEEIARGLVDNGRRQSLDLVAEIEQLFGRSRTDLSTASSLVRDKTDRVLREVDRVRRQAGGGPAFPIEGYDDLTAAQVGERLKELDAADLRKVREHEKRTANRKSVLAAVDKALG